MWIPLDNCTTCPNDLFEICDSTCTTMGTIAEDIQYGLGYVSGKQMTTCMALVGDNTTFDMLTIGVDETEDFQGHQADGIIGLSPTPHGRLDLFVENLKEANITNSTMFAVDLRLTTDVSDIFFGGYETSRIKEGS